MPVWVRYAAFQLPEGIVAGLALLGLYSVFDWSAVVVWSLFAAWIGKEIALYPFVKDAYDDRPSPHVGAERMLGAIGVADEELAPRGYVRVRGELWRAELLGRERLAPGSKVSVHGVRDLTLLVRPEEG